VSPFEPPMDYDPPMDDASLAAMLASLGNQVRDARLTRQWYLSELAERVGVSQSVICRMELARREPSMHQVLTVCGVLAHRPSMLFRMAEDDAFPMGHGPWT
jgi:transcriptional regulator with XRE-family HTH domain